MEAYSSAGSSSLALPGNKVSILGDSITGSLSPPLPGTSSQSYGPSSPISSLMHACPRVIPWGAFGVSGDNAGDALARIGEVTGLSIKPDYCLVLLGTNDAGQGVPFDTYAANMTAIVERLRAAGIRPILMTVPPVPTTVLGNGETRRGMADGYNAFLIRLAQREGVPILDYRTAVMDTAGDWLAGYSGDGVHPTNPGYRAMAVELAALIEAGDHIADWSPPFPAFDLVGSVANLAPNGLFLRDTAGTPDGWIIAGTGTPSIVAAPGAPVVGNAFQFAGTDGTYTQAALQLDANAWTEGDRIACVGRFRIPSTPTSGGAFLDLTISGATPAQQVRPFTGYGFDTNGWCSFYLEHIIPATTTTGQLKLAAQGVGLTPEIAQVGVFNLTALGYTDA